MYSLKLERVPGSQGNPALASILIEARRTAERPELQTSHDENAQKLA